MQALGLPSRKTHPHDTGSLTNVSAHNCACSQTPHSACRDMWDVLGECAYDGPVLAVPPRPSLSHSFGRKQRTRTHTQSLLFRGVGGG